MQQRAARRRGRCRPASSRPSGRRRASATAPRRSRRAPCRPRRRPRCPSSRSSSSRSPARTTAWSSTIRTRTLTAAAPPTIERRARALPRLDLERAAEQRDPLAHALRPKPPSRSRRVEAAAVVLDQRRHRPPSCASSTMLTLPAPRVLDDVRQRLLDDPVERRLGLGRQPLVAERCSRSTAIPSAPRSVSVSRSSAGTRPKSSSTFGRSSTASRRTSCSVADDELAQLAHGGARLVAVERLLERPARAGSTSAPGRSRRAARARAAGARAPARRPRGAARRARRARRDRRDRRAEANVSARRRSVVGEARRRAPSLSYAAITPIARSRTTSGT